MEKDCVRIGVIGIGNMGLAHATCIVNDEIKGLKLTAVCDADVKKLDSFSEAHPEVKCYDKYEDMLSSGVIDAVIISVPHRFHADFAVKAFEYGLHVLVEKPEDVSVSKASELNEAAKKSGKVFAIMFNQRTNPIFRKAKEIVSSGELGKLKRSVWIVTNWYRTQYYYNSGDWRATWSGEGGGVLLNQAPHNLDLWQWICGMPETVTAFCSIAKYHDIEVEDEATIITTYPSGAVGTFITSTGEYPGTNRLEITGELGKLVLENGTIKWWKLKENEAYVRMNVPESFTKIDCDYEEVDRFAPETAHRGILKNFADAILYGAELISPGYEGINELAISNAAYLSSFNGNKKITIPFDSEEFDGLLSKLRENSVQNKTLTDEKNGGKYKSRWSVNW